ncbi:MAG: hypothetical protein JSS86_24695 [Cyanobacteria bacterium SZAS LIN-2]|nr:hypothetical protein [Cyanobacteria bacterium SZAS LIN-2]
MSTPAVASPAKSKGEPNYPSSIAVPARPRGVNSIYQIENLAEHLVMRHHVLDGRRLLEPACKRPNATSRMHAFLAKAYMDDPEQDSRILSRVDGELQTAVRLDPENGMAYSFMAEFDNLQGEYKRALVNAQKALTVKKPFPDALRQLAIAHSNLGDYKAALAETEARAKVNGRTEAYFLSMGDLLEKLNRRPEAVQNYREALKMRNVDTTVNKIVACLESDGKYQDAIVEISKLIQKNPIDSEALAKRGELQAKLKHYKESIADYTAAIDLDESARLYSARAQVYKSMGLRQKADDDIASAKKASAANF